MSHEERKVRARNLTWPRKVSNGNDCDSGTAHSVGLVPSVAIFGLGILFFFHICLAAFVGLDK